MVVAATVLVLWVYARGAQRASAWRRVGFVGGTAALFLALQSPLDALAEQSFALHQIQHLALLSLVPMLIALSAPAGPLLAGMPDWLRRSIYVPVSANRVVMAIFGMLSAPVAAAAYFIAAMLFWLQPGMQAVALQNETIHDLMHFSMLLAGMFLYFCAFDPRAPPTGSGYGARIFALLAVLLVNIPLGAFLSYKEAILYPAYAGVERIGLAPLADERVGGLIQYLPGSMMYVVAVLLVFRLWRHHESRLERWGQRGLRHGARVIDTGNALARRNLRFAIKLAVVCVFMFVAALASGLLMFVWI